MRTNNLPRFTEFTPIIERYYHTLFQFATRLCGNPARGMVLTQQTFRLAFEHKRATPEPMNIRTWLFTLLMHCFLEPQPPISIA